jgi:SAM-dependent methyltransferase
MDKIWIGSPTDVRQGNAANAALEQVSDEEYWNEETGIIRVDEERWRQAQHFESEGWLKHWREAKDDRNTQHAAGFDSYKTVPPKLGDVLEIGCGPFTQLKTIQQGRSIETVTLLDPLLENYLQLPNCTYRDGKFLDHPTTLLCHAAELLKGVEEYDTIICINVLEHVQDVAAILLAMHRALRYGSTIIFGERVYDGLNISEVYDIGHPIRVKMKVFLKWEERFEHLYRVIPRIKNDPLNQEHYFIGKKNA